MAKALALAAGVLAAALLVTLTGCFGGASAYTCSTNEQCNANGIGTCQPDSLCSYADASCMPSGQRYGDNAGDKSNTCVGGSGGDGGTLVCFGAADGLVKPCFPTTPTEDITLPSMIDTTNDPRCSSTVTEADGFCVIAGERILVNVSVTATGSKPLVLVANSMIEISATLDVSSRHSTDPDPPYTTRQIGAGSGPAACVTGTLPVNGGVGGGGGGGAGGTFGGAGGVGGAANDGGMGGMPGGVQPVTTFRGGCPGQEGIRGTFGQGGHGGGAVYLIAKTEIRIASAINASGEGGLPGLAGSAGAGGGGSGGMIGLDAPMIMNMGVIFANGGSGGEGSNDTVRGNPGPEANGVAPSTPPLGNNADGGDGGGGGAAVNAAGPGLPGTGGMNDGGGGGGGGGVGVIKVFSGAIMGTGQISPNPS